MNPDLPPLTAVAPCTPWCLPPNPDDESGDDADAMAWCCPADLSREGVYERAVYAATVASSVLFRLSGYRFSGACSAVEYLCVRTMPCGCVGLGCGDGWRSYPMPVGDGEHWTNVPCGCGPACDCLARQRVALPYGPVLGVTNVEVNGEEVLSDDYRIIDGRWMYLRNITAATLAAACFDPFADPPGGFLVEWTYGQAPPPDGVMAACSLACEILKSCLDEDCKLPKRVTSLTRQGVTFALLDPMTFLNHGRTGIYEVDLFLAGYDTPQTTVTFVDDVAPIDFSERARPRW